MSTRLGQTVLAFAASLALGPLAGCLQPRNDPGNDSGMQRPGTTNEDRQNELGITCDAELAITGTFEPGAPKPDDVSGCWPVGIWRFSPSVVSNNCPTEPRLEKEYAFQVDVDEELTEFYTYLNDPTYERVRIKVSSGGGGICEGGLTLWSADGKTIWNLKPALQADNSLNGHGEYEIYEEDQY